ncbi:glycoside hydrolase family 9 protein [uncultured Ruminococcus sp.]|uniref:glycoside hydrolase family 9 protein n=1 Tax=uncultured Ruminococcus sp. TaxID=165186 RepID=UPI0025F1C6D2|nr:glycoside hydrolase family 9 protein [uncultured Ruminococcus sp.]
MGKGNFLKRSLASVSAAAMMLTGNAVTLADAAVIDKENPNNYHNYAEALQLALCFYDANKCGDEVTGDGYYSWRNNCHVKDGYIPLQPMSPMPNVNKGKTDDQLQEDQGLGTGDDGKTKPNLGDTDPSLYVGVNMSQKFIDKNKKYLDPDGDGTLDLTGGWHDAGDHVKFGLPGSYSASTVGWGYYEFRDSYKELGLDKHVEDELHWINDYFMKVTFMDDDDNVIAYCYQVGEGNNDHNYWCPPELQVEDTMVASSSCAVKRPAYFATEEMPASDQCAGAAASLAINYLNFKDTEPAYAKKCLKYAKALYDFAVKTHVEDWEPGKVPNCYSLGYDGGFYTSSYDYDELAWAAVWLYYCTEDYDYINDIIAVDETTTNDKGAHPYTGYMKRIITDTGNCWQNIWVHCWDTVWGGVFAKLAPVTNTARDWYIFRYNLEFWSGCAENVDSSDWGYEPVHGHKYFGMDDYLWNTEMTADQIADLPISETSGDFIAKSPKGWAVVSGYGSARYNTAAGLCACVYAKTTKDETFLPWARAQMEYILGNNPMGYAYEVGYGNNFASHPHHRASHCSATQSMDDPITQVHTLWGALVGGPDLKDHHEDVTKDYIYNEVTDDYNAGFCGDLAGLYHYYGRKGGKDAKENHIIENFDMSSNAKGFDQIDEDGNPLPVGYFVSGGKAQEKEDGIQLKVVLHNRTVDPPRFECDVKARYFFNIKELQDKGYDIDYITARIDYDQVAGYSNNKSHAVLSDPVKYDNKGTYYVEITWKDCKFYGSRVYQFALTTKMDPDKYVYPEWDSSNDYSYPDLVSFDDDNAAEAITDKITLYADGKLIWGTEPNGKTAADETSNNTESVNPTVKCDSTTSNSAKISWNKVSGATKYGIFGYEKGTWKKVTELTGTSYTFSSLKPSKSYKIAVLAFVNGKYTSDFSKALTFTTKSESYEDTTGVYPEIIKVDYSEDYHQIRFTWKPVKGATNYGIAVYLAGKWRVQTTSISSSTYSYTTPKNLTPGKTYRVAVAAKVNGTWTATESLKHTATVTVK